MFELEANVNVAAATNPNLLTNRQELTDELLTIVRSNRAASGPQLKELTDKIHQLRTGISTEEVGRMVSKGFPVAKIPTSSDPISPEDLYSFRREFGGIAGFRTPTVTGGEKVPEFASPAANKASRGVYKSISARTRALSETAGVPELNQVTQRQAELIPKVSAPKQAGSLYERALAAGMAGGVAKAAGAGALTASGVGLGTFLAASPEALTGIYKAGAPFAPLIRSTAAQTFREVTRPRGARLSVPRGSQPPRTGR